MLAEIPRDLGISYCVSTLHPIPTPKQEKLNKNQHDTYNITLHIIHNLYNHNTSIPYSISITHSSHPLSLYLNPKIATHIKNQILFFILLHLYSLQTRKSDHKNFQAIGFMAITMSPQGPKTYTIRQSQSPKSSTQ